ncbi:ABC-type branched-subunit amino acid transport system ATPase component [Variovorax boronicumulans]|uniref:hypothetical protein n=1 Tax=Variovorax boronicumulans TaxID=436515 RepID=UPI002474C5EF|nr:hypothetical protein [Variovorax boronicumulans]MDH6169442.1 ABC-type branched-subunit amino acid transport system ATPase component [Variovorax boronicumulans]
MRRINADAGLSVLLVEQNAVAALSIAQRAYVLENGRVVMAGSAESLSSNSDVQEFYLGGASGQQKDYHTIKHYRRRKRWLT